MTTDMEPTVTDEQPLTDVDPLPPLGDDEVYIDSLEEYETCRDDERQTPINVELVVLPADDDITTIQDQPAAETDASSMDTLPQELNTNTTTDTDQPDVNNIADPDQPDVNNIADPDQPDVADPDTLPTVTKDVHESVEEERSVPAEESEPDVADVTVTQEVPCDTRPDDDEELKRSSVEHVEEELLTEVDNKDTSGQSEDDEVYLRVLLLIVVMYTVSQKSTPLFVIISSTLN